MADGILAHDLHVAYRAGEPVLRGVSLDLPAGSFTAVIGPNGSGKTTLLKTLAGLLRCERGWVRLGDLDPARVRPAIRARRVAYLPQREPEDVPFSALDLVLMGRFAFQGWLPFDRAADIDAAERCLGLVGAQGLRDRLLGEMSGGERQRVHLARALAQEPSILLLDEPAASLDFRHQVEAYRLLHRLNREQGQTVVLVSHDLNLPAAFASVIVVLENGGIAASGPPAAILRAAVLEPIYRTPILESRAPGLELPLLFPAP